MKRLRWNQWIGDGDAFTGDFITSKQPFYFSVLLPDGNWWCEVMAGGYERKIGNNRKSGESQINVGEYTHGDGKSHWTGFYRACEGQLNKKWEGEVVSKVEIEAKGD